MNLTRNPEQMSENVWRFDVKRPTDSWTKNLSYPIPPDTLLSNTSCSRIALEQERMKRFRGRKTCDVMLGICPCQLTSA